MDMSKAKLAAFMLMVSISLAIFGICMVYEGSWFIGLLILIAAADLFMTVCWNKPIIKKGPIGKYFYPD